LFELENFGTNVVVFFYILFSSSVFLNVQFFLMVLRITQIARKFIFQGLIKKRKSEHNLQQMSSITLTRTPIIDVGEG
jgi:hypothetical protein